jgi:hypothetical protein
MSDARWGDPREHGGRERGDERPRVYDDRDRDDCDPRDGLMHDLDLLKVMNSSTTGDISMGGTVYQEIFTSGVGVAIGTSSNAYSGFSWKASICL